MKKAKALFFLHLLLLLYSISSVCSKLAANSPFFSLRFCLCYGAIILILGIYAVGWQQIIKYLSLTTAFANKAVTIVWGIIWGILFFHETITVGKLLGAILVIVGVILFVSSDKGEDKV